MTSFHSWDEVKEEVFDTEDLDEITAGARRMVAEARAHRLADRDRDGAEPGADAPGVAVSRVEGCRLAGSRPTTVTDGAVDQRLPP
jgi:hypothetical protein